MIYHDDYVYRGPAYGKLIGCPDEVRGYFDCRWNCLTSLEGVSPVIEGTLFANCNRIESLANIGKQLKSCPKIICSENGISSNILGLLLIHNLRTILSDSVSAFSIIRRWLGNKEKTAIFRCQKELIDAGFEEYAKL